MSVSRAWHHEQELPNSCVAACMCMLDKARGAPHPESFYGPSPQQPGNVLSLPRTRAVRGAKQEREIEVELSTDALLVVVTVMCSPYVTWQRRTGWSLLSAHGPLAAPGTHGGGLHTIALVGRTRDGFRALDPYYPIHDPFDIDDDSFSSFFAGHAYAAEL